MITQVTARQIQLPHYDIDVDDMNLEELLSLDEGVIFTVNLDHLYLLRRNAQFRNAYKQADVVTCDSTYLFHCLKWIGQPIKEKVCGSDLIPAFCISRSRCTNTKIFLLGGIDDTACRAESNINGNAGRELVVGSISPTMNFVNSVSEQSSVISAVNRSGANVLMVGLGAPKQEIWVTDNRTKMPNVKLIFAVGATLDYMAGTRSRAPTWLRKLGLEWAYRVVREPRRYLLRYIRDVEFFWFMLPEIFASRTDDPRSD